MEFYRFFLVALRVKRLAAKCRFGKGPGALLEDGALNVYYVVV
jgi:hypothetical protein